MARKGDGPVGGDRPPAPEQQQQQQQGGVPVVGSTGGCACSVM